MGLMVLQTESTVQTSAMRLQAGFLWAAYTPLKLRFQVAFKRRKTAENVVFRNST